MKGHAPARPAVHRRLSRPSSACLRGGIPSRTRIRPAHRSAGPPAPAGRRNSGSGRSDNFILSRDRASSHERRSGFLYPQGGAAAGGPAGRRAGRPQGRVLALHPTALREADRHAAPRCSSATGNAGGKVCCAPASPAVASHLTTPRAGPVRPRWEADG